MSFVNLHGHSHFSLLDGFGSPKDIVLRVKELGYPAVALTDHGVTYGLVEFYQAAKAAGVKPILGCEMYVAPRTRFDKEVSFDTKPYHLVLLAETNEGYENLLTLVTKAHLEGFYYKPRVDYDLLREYSKGLIATSACQAGHIGRLILADKMGEAEEMVRKYIDIFGKDNYFLEIQDQPLSDTQGIMNEGIKKLGKKFDQPIILTTDSHYPKPEDRDVHDILLCMQTGTTIDAENRMRYTGDYSIRPIDDLKQAVKDCPEAIENTVKIAERCNVELKFGTNLIPSFDTPNKKAADIYLRELCEEGLKGQFGKKKVPKEYIERLDFELNTVHEMGFDEYFLIVHDFVRYAKDKGIIVGPGRGSAAGSIIAWSLDITELDPIEYGLFFERFLNPERISMPDIDIDFADHRRDEVLAYVVEKYGRDNVAQIITFGTMAAKAVVRDVGRVLGYPYAEVDALAKLVPQPILGKHNPLRVSIVEDPDFRKEYENNPRAKVLLDYAKHLEGTVRHAGTHACAVVISEKPLTKYTALQYGAGGSKDIVTQYPMKPLENLGLLKMDFLGLRNLTIIENTLKIVKAIRNEDIDIRNLPLNDKKTFKLFQQGNTTGIFQFESAGMKRYLKELKPTIFEDIEAMGALYRPGPMEWIPNYIKGKHEPSKVKYLDKSFKGVLASTYGVAVYQEQILQIARDFAGFSLGEADILRKAVGKKIPKLLIEQRAKFVEGAVKNGHKEKFAEKVFEDVIEPFAGYGFNKAHAACYGMIAYQTAYLKSRYPIEFMAALLISDAGNTDRIVLDVKECADMAIEVLPPSINESRKHFSVIDKTRIRFGMLSIKGVGEAPIQKIIEERIANGKYTSIENLAKRLPPKIINKKLIQALAYAGALDDLGDRKQIAENYEEISKYSKHCHDSLSAGQTDIFAAMPDEGVGQCEFQMHDSPKATQMESLRWEKDHLGMYVSGHPLRGLRKYIGKKGNLIGELKEKDVGKVVKVCGLLSNVRKILTRSGSYMAIFKIEDPSGVVGGIMFPKVFAKFGDVLVEDAVMAFSGRFDCRSGQYQVAVDVAKPLGIESMIENAKEVRAYDPKDNSGIGIRNIDDILAEEKAEKEALTETPSLNKDIFTISIPSTIPPADMAKIKKLLLDHKGKTQVELELNGTKRIKLPFGINVTDEFKTKVDSLLHIAK